MNHSIVMNATKTRSRYVSLAAVLSDQNTVAKDRPLPSVFLCLWSLCTITYRHSIKKPQADRKLCQLRANYLSVVPPNFGKTALTHTGNIRYASSVTGAPDEAY